MDIKKLEALRVKAEKEALTHKAKSLKATLMVRHWEVEILKNKFSQMDKLIESGEVGRGSVVGLWDRLEVALRRKASTKECIEAVTAKLDDMRKDEEWRERMSIA